MIDERKKAGARRRGWVAFGAGLFLIVFVSAVWIWVDGLLANPQNVQSTASLAQFAGKLNIAFALIVVCGVLGAINGWQMAHAGARNRVLVIAIIVLFAIALILAYSASSAVSPA